MDNKQQPQEKDFGKDVSGGPLGDNARRNEILEEHARNFPEGDPSVRRKNPEKGKI